MYIKEDFSFTDLQDRCWEGAVDTLETIEKADKEGEFLTFLENYYEGEIPTITDVNDLLWFEEDMILEELEIDEETLDNDEEEL